MRNEIERMNKGQTCFINLQKAFDTLVDGPLAEKIETFSEVQPHEYSKTLFDLYIIDNKHLYSVFSEHQSKNFSMCHDWFSGQGLEERICSFLVLFGYSRLIIICKLCIIFHIFHFIQIN